MGRPWIAPALALFALMASTAALWASLNAFPASAVASGDRVNWVIPDGPAWAAGIRPEQPVVEMDPPDRPEDWRMRTRTATGTTVATKSGMIESLRMTESISVMALLAAVAAVALAGRRPSTAGALAVASLVAARPALLATGDLAASTIAVLAALAVPAIWLIAWSGRRRSAWAIAGLVVVVGTAWLVNRVLASTDASMADPYSMSAFAVIVLTWLLSGAVILAAISPTLRARGSGYQPRQLGDLVVLGGLLVAVPIALALNVSALAAVAVMFAVLSIYPLTRRRIGRALDRLVLGDIRARSSVDAIERERRRVSREIHDQPLQELATVIHRLAGKPELAAEAAMLQEVSGQLRGVTMQLHPPILTDLGLGPALRHLAADLDAGASMPVRADVQTNGDERPPEAVELAAYRIAQEAMGNAIHHSAARMVTLFAVVSTAHVSVDVTDDGVGLDGVAMGEAVARGRMGLRSMAERAQLVGGDLRFEDAKAGTRVRFRWPA